MHITFDASGVPKHTEIDLRTRLNQKIDNLQPWSYAPIEWKMLFDPDNPYEKAGAERVGEVCPVYNCHGLTFASRRTQIEGSDATIRMILEDDGFREIPDKSVSAGDVVIYYGEVGEVIHSGIVIRVEKFDIPRIWIWSKWGKGFEWVHPLTVCHYNFSAYRFYRLKIWNPKEISKTN